MEFTFHFFGHTFFHNNFRATVVVVSARHLHARPFAVVLRDRVQVVATDDETRQRVRVCAVHLDGGAGVHVDRHRRHGTSVLRVGAATDGTPGQRSRQRFVVFLVFHLV